MELTAIDFNTATKLYSYTEYKNLVNTLFSEGKVTGNTQSEGLLLATKMNLHRIARIEKTASLKAELQKAIQNVNTKWTWYVIIESWCGDGSQIIPVMDKMAASNPNINLQFLLRDENPEIMEAYLSNGNKAIPKLICVNEETGDELGTWGPRPQKIQDEVNVFKQENPEIFKAEIGKKLHLWYAKDKGNSIQDEFIEAINHWNN